MAYVIAAYGIVLASLVVYGMALGRERRRLERALAMRKMPVDSRDPSDV